MGGTNNKIKYAWLAKPVNEANDEENHCKNKVKPNYFIEKSLFWHSITQKKKGK